MGKYINRTMSLVILLAGAGFVSASTVIPLNLRELSTLAHRVVAGKVERITSFQDSTTGRIVSRVEIQETQSVSGAVPATAFTFEMTGGTAGGLRQWIAGFPTFQAGDQIVLFLAEDTTTPLGPTVGLWQGVFFVETDAGGQETIINHARKPVTEIRGDDLVITDLPRGGARLAQPGPRVTLDSFLSRVRGFRQAAGVAGRR